jgi:uridine phosphorylase
MSSSEPAQPITGLRSGEVGPNVFLCGDPARVARIAQGWSNVREVVNVREYRIAVGELDGVPLAAASTGIGAPSTAVVVEELAKVGARTLIRIGNSGGIDPSLGLGDLVVTTGAVRDDGTSRSYVCPEYPAVAHHEVVGALLAAAREGNVTAHAGVTWSLDAFYARNSVLGANGAIEPMCFGGYRPPGLERKLEELRGAGVRNCEMESGVLLTLAGLYGLRAGCICVISDRTPWPGPSELDLDKNMAACIRVATAAMLRLAKPQ